MASDARAFSALIKPCQRRPACHKHARPMPPRLSDRPFLSVPRISRTCPFRLLRSHASLDGALASRNQTPSLFPLLLRRFSPPSRDTACSRVSPLREPSSLQEKGSRIADRQRTYTHSHTPRRQSLAQQHHPAPSTPASWRAGNQTAETPCARSSGARTPTIDASPLQLQSCGRGGGASGCGAKIRFSGGVVFASSLRSVAIMLRPAKLLPASALSAFAAPCGSANFT